MNIKSKNLQQSHDLKPKSSLTPAFNLCFRVFRFSLLTFCFLASLSSPELSGQLKPGNFVLTLSAPNSQDANIPNVPTGRAPTQFTRLLQNRQTQPQTTDITPVNFVAHVDKKSPQGSLLIAESPGSNTARQLWQASISIARNEKDNRNKNELRRIIEQIRFVEFKPQEKGPEPVISVQPALTIEPNAVMQTPEKLTKAKIESGTVSYDKSDSLPTGSGKMGPSENGTRLPYEPVTEQTLQMLQSPSQHPDQVRNPFELAEILFRSGHLKEALKYYQEALNRKSPDEAGSTQDRAWILFQIGNCLRDQNSPTAAEMYKQLITEYPNSLWTDSAKAQDKLIELYRNQNPKALIRERISQEVPK